MDTNSREAVIESIRGLRLMGFDWDGVQGLPLRGDVDDTIVDLYDGASELLDDSLDNLPMPVVSLNSNGTIEVDYKDPETDRRLVLTFQSAGVITYVKFYADGQTSVEGVIRADTLERFGETTDCVEFIELLDWLAE